MSTLLIDLGNTALKWAWADSPEHDQTYVHHGRDLLPDELQQLWIRLRPQHVIGCTVGSENVAFAATRFFNTHGFGWSWLKAQKQFRGSFVLNNRYDNVQQLGADRWFAAIGAVSLFPGRAILVMHMGTATTVDVVMPETNGLGFLGGRILPGPTMMLDALLTHTGCRPGGVGLPQDFPSNTADAIATAILDAHLGVIASSKRAVEEKGFSPVLVFAGGAAPMLAPYILKHYPHAVLKHNLVLYGLAAQAQAASKE